MRKSPSERATIRLVTLFTGREMELARRRTSRIDTTNTARVHRMATSIARLIILS